MLLGDSNVGKSSLVFRLVNVSHDKWSMDDSTGNMGQEITKQKLFCNSPEEIKAIIVSKSFTNNYVSVRHQRAQFQEYPQPIL